MRIQSVNELEMRALRLKIIAAIWLCLPSRAPLPHTPGGSQIANAAKQEATVTQFARGSFDVKLNPQTPYEEMIGRMSIDKEFKGDLQGTSRGEMLGVMGTVKGSGGYVAMERVNGNLRGRTGTFVLQHSGANRRGESQMTVTVVPDSGTAQLEGLEGAMTITVEGGIHLYSFEFSLPKPQ